MNVLVITGDKNFAPGHPRYELQKSSVESLDVVFWGRGSIWPEIPQGPFDVVTVQDPFWRGLFAWRIAKKLRAKFNVQVHTDLSAHSLTRRLLARFVIHGADTVRVVSEKIKKQITHPRIFVLPVYVDIEKFKILERRPELNTVLWVGRFEDEKDPLFALEVVRAVPNAKLIMLGTGSLEPLIRERAKNMAVTLPGWQDPAMYLPRAVVVLCTSKHESFGASIVEALAAGVPVVAPDVGAAREVGAIVVPREKLAEAVGEVLQSGTAGKLQISLLTKEAWAQAWRETLI